MANKFKKGDVVVLKSGGPKMTVVGNKQMKGLKGAWEEPDEYEVTWQNKDDKGNYKTERDFFHEDLLTRAKKA